MGDKTQKDEMFDATYRSYAADIYRVCLHLTEDEEKAQNITQQTFVNFYEHSDSMDSEHTFAYLVCTAKRLACNDQKEFRQKK